uniref:Uncharacterized protein LOC105132278 isoform X2 n=1 Tax=Rhizophora mucronata TaxID=61149 RepID=A0A2P2L4A0_RHIMU
MQSQAPAEFEACRALAQKQKAGYLIITSA